MPRPFKQKNIVLNPECTYFKPIGLPRETLEEVNLKLEEFEAFRLSFLEDYSNIEAGNQMNTSASTFNRLLQSAGKKIADALVNGKSINICEVNLDQEHFCRRNHNGNGICNGTCRRIIERN